MCGRFGLTRTPGALAKRLGARFDEARFAARYNVAPTQPVLAVTNDVAREVVELRWGLVPYWSQGPGAMKLTTFNARIETIATSRVYREALHARRCAIFADGYYEWHREPDGTKTPVWIYRNDREPFVFAGLWETWRSRENGETLRSCTIVTQPPNAFAERIHSRMPVVLDTEAARTWLEPGPRDPAASLALLEPTPAALWTAHDVDRRVGNVRHDDAGLIAERPDG